MLKKITKKIFRITKAFFSGIFWYVRDWFLYRNLLKASKQKTALKLFPQIFDRDPASHTFDKHYVYMDRWAFKYLLKEKPIEHIDVGSSIRFLSMATTVTRVKFVDIRPVHLDLDNFQCLTGSILQMPFKDNSVMSLSCLHVAEHIGLGRYGDPLDVEGTKKACRELARILAPGGILYFALPVGQQATYFNAHRVHRPETVLKYFSGLELAEFSAVSDQGRYVERANPADFEQSIYACGMFKFIKR